MNAATQTRLQPLATHNPLQVRLSISKTIGHFRALLEEARPKVLGIFSLRFMTGAILADGALLTFQAFSGLLAWFGVTISVYVLNGVSDLAGDRANGSTRPLASGRLSVKAAWRSILVLALISIGLGLSISPVFGALVVIALVLGLTYSVGPRAKKLTSRGAIATVIIGGLITYAAGSLAGAGEIGLDLLAFGVVMSLWMGVGALVKDLHDIIGDRVAGRTTLAVTRGAVAVAVAAALLVTLTASLLLVASVWLPLLRPSAWVLIVGGLCLIFSLTVWAWFGKDSPYRVFMKVQYATHVVILGA